MAEKTKVRALTEGDMIDLLELGEDYPLGKDVRDMAQYYLAAVIGEGDDDTPWTVESADCWVLHTTSGSFGMHPDWEFEVKGKADVGGDIL